MEVAEQALVSADVIAEAKALRDEVLPEFRVFPQYYVSPPAGYPTRVGRTAAFTYKSCIDSLLQDHLEATGEWRGPGIAIVFCVPMDRTQALGTIAHEWAHGPCISKASPFRELPAARRVHAVMLEDHIHGPRVDTIELPPGHGGHGPWFIRRALHLHYRLWQLGIQVGLPEMTISGPQYNTSPTWRYRQALGDEPRRMAKASMAEINATAMPKGVRKLFHQDYQGWLADRAITSNTEEVYERCACKTDLDVRDRTSCPVRSRAGLSPARTQTCRRRRRSRAGPSAGGTEGGGPLRERPYKID